MSASNEAGSTASPEFSRRDAIRNRWTLHGLNNGTIFRWTYRGVRFLPRWISYGIGRIGTWIAWRSMPRTRAALAANLRPVFPDEPERALEARAHHTLASYANDVIDFMRSLDASGSDLAALFDYSLADAQMIGNLLSKGQGLILVTGHYGNWEIGALFIRRVVNLPVTIIAMAEENPTVNQIRREIRELIGADTIEVGQSLDTALQIRRRLATNNIVAVLMDRAVGRDRVGVQLFGRRVGFLRTPALMAFTTGAPLLPCFIERVRSGRFMVRAGAPIVVDQSKTRDEAIQTAAQEFADQLSVRVQRHPEYWYHFYRYWDLPGGDGL